MISSGASSDFEFAAMNRNNFCLPRSDYNKIIAALQRGCAVGFFQVTEHLSDKGFPGASAVGAIIRVGISIFRLQISDHFGIRFLPQPKIIIHALVAVDDRFPSAPFWRAAVLTIVKRAQRLQP